MPVTEQDVMSALKSCYDPEIPVNIVDLGLIYNVNFAPAPEDKQDVTIDMTLTAQGCPEHVNISMQVKSRLEQLPGIRRRGPRSASARMPGSNLASSENGRRASDPRRRAADLTEHLKLEVRGLWSQG